MANKIEFDLATLKDIFEHGFDLGFCRLHSCIPEVTIGSEVLAAIQAGYFGGVGNIIGPSDQSPAFSTVK